MKKATPSNSTEANNSNNDKKGSETKKV